MYFVVTLHWQYQGQEGVAYDTYGYPAYTADCHERDAPGAWTFWYKEGNGACDCNRARTIGLPHALPCGESIVYTAIEQSGPLLNNVQEG